MKNSLYTESDHYEKTILSDFQGAGESLEAAVIDPHLSKLPY